MKKFIFFFALIVLTLGLTGCLGQAPTPADTDTDEQSPADDADVSSDASEAALDASDDRADDFKTDDSEATDEGGMGAGPAVDADETADSPAPENPDSEQEPSANNEAGAETPAPTGNIIVETPKPNETVTSPFEVTGQARVSEGTVLVRVRNQDGKIVVPELVVTARPSEVGEFGPFKIKINYQFYATKEGTVEVFSQSPDDGSEINMVEVPVKFE